MGARGDGREWGDRLGTEAPVPVGFVAHPLALLLCGELTREPGVGARRGSGDPPHFDYLGSGLAYTPVFIIAGVHSRAHAEICAGLRAAPGSMRSFRVAHGERIEMEAENGA